MTFHAIPHCSPWTFFFFFILIQYLFVFLPSNPEPTTFPGCLGSYRKGNIQGRHRRKYYGGGNSSFISWRRWARPPSGKRAPWPLRGPSPWRRRATVSEKGSWHNSDEAPKHSPNSRPGASHPCCGSSSSRELGCCVKVLWNGTGLEAVAKNKWDDLGTWGCQAAVALMGQCLWSFTISVDSDHSTGGTFSQSGRG